MVIDILILIVDLLILGFLVYQEYYGSQANIAHLKEKPSLVDSMMEPIVKMKNVVSVKETPKVSVAPESTKAEAEEEEKTLPNQVFHLPENVYTYDDAKIVCKSMGAELASLSQINEAQKKGANWCNYGWSKQQMALYPIQKDYWDNIQDDEALRKSCGFPGVNGGYFKNKKLLFGANCYGPKPQPKKAEGVLDYETSRQQQKDTQTFFSYKHDVPRVAPFSYEKWSQHEE